MSLAEPESFNARILQGPIDVLALVSLQDGVANIAGSFEADAGALALSPAAIGTGWRAGYVADQVPEDQQILHHRPGPRRRAGSTGMGDLYCSTTWPVGVVDDVMSNDVSEA